MQFTNEYSKFLRFTCKIFISFWIPVHFRLKINIQFLTLRKYLFAACRHKMRWIAWKPTSTSIRFVWMTRIELSELQNEAFSDQSNLQTYDFEWNGIHVIGRCNSIFSSFWRTPDWKEAPPCLLIIGYICNLEVWWLVLEMEKQVPLKHSTWGAKWWQVGESKELHSI